MRRIGNRLQQFGGRFSGGSGSGNDSLEHRNKFEDSLTISFRYLDSSLTYRLDSSIADFALRYPVPAHWIYLGNTGNAARSLLFSPESKAGFDPGFHAYDLYMYKAEAARFFNTTRPYSEINYFLGSRTEQIIELMHTQNLKPEWNIAFQYRLINSPGYYKSQKTNHNNYQLTSLFQSKNKRYKNYFVITGNKIQSGENGGLQDPSLLDNPVYKDRFTLTTRLGGDDPFSSNFFSTKINTGNTYNLFTLLMRQQYDLGKKDSVVTDSTIIPLFYPRLRFEHTFRVDKSKFVFKDVAADSVYYKNFYDTSLRRPIDTLFVKDEWKIWSNDFSIIQFPDARNLRQFIRLGILFENISGTFTTSKKEFINTSGHIEYQNKTRNQMWDISALGTIYFTGFNQGDFHAGISLQRIFGKKGARLKTGFENTSRTPSFIFNPSSSFYFRKQRDVFNKENNTHLYAVYFLPHLKWGVSVHYYLASNFTYLQNHFQAQQQQKIFQVGQVVVQKTIGLGKKWLWHAELYFQKAGSQSPLQLPWVYSRNRIGYEGNLGFRNLDIALGAEVRYRPPYKADDYSPVMGRFFYQHSTRITNKVPDISAYLHFRIRSIKMYIRAENLNTARYLEGVNFTNNNQVAPGYALPGLQIRTGIYWNFVN